MLRIVREREQLVNVVAARRAYVFPVEAGSDNDVIQSPEVFAPAAPGKL